MKNRDQERADEIRRGGVAAAARLITDIENDPVAAAQPVLSALYPACGAAHIVGVTGPPGAGKSTLVAALIGELRRRERTVGVVAVDPSSPFTGGALLGDRDRMIGAAGDEGTFIRSVAARGASGGLAAAVNGAVDVMDAMGKDIVLVETVGVGQGELDIARIAHTVVLTMVPGYGDALQAMKAGITEIADVVAVNKADAPGAEEAARELAAQDLARRGPDGAAWGVPILLTMALRGDGVSALVDALDDHRAFASEHGWTAERERERRVGQFAERVSARMRAEVLAAAQELVNQLREVPQPELSEAMRREHREHAVE